MFKKNSKNFEVLIVGFVILLNTLILSQGISSSFFYDEAVYVNLAWHPLKSDFYFDPIFYRHPPLYPTLLFLWGKIFGYSEIAMRSASILFSNLSILFLYKIGLKITTQKAAILSCILLIFNPFFQQYSQAATMYVLQFLLILWFFWSMLTHRKKQLLTAMVLLIYNHFFSIYLIPCYIFFLVVNKEAVWKYLFYLFIFTTPLIGILIPATVLHSGNTNFFELKFWFTHLKIFESFLPTILILTLAWSAYKLYKENSNFRIILISLIYILFLIINHKGFSRYWYPFLGILYLIGITGLEKLCGQKKVIFFLIIILGLTELYFDREKFDIEVTKTNVFDKRDIIKNQNWKNIASLIPDDATIFTNNSKSFLYYKLLNNYQNYDVIQKEMRPHHMSLYLKEYCFDWIIYSNFHSEKFTELLLNNYSEYYIYKKVGITWLYKNKNECKK
jgi:4-amino-4-deoxy-L-arabinose transferase-like glycosyltransferase